jgi:hypothetical protein
MARGKKNEGNGPSTEALAALLNPKLTAFEGQEVTACAVELPNAGGGLHESLAFEPVEFHVGEEGYMLVHWKNQKVRFDPIKDTEYLKRVHVLGVTETMLVDEQFAEAHFADQRKRLQKLRDEARGTPALPGMNGDEEGGEDGDGDEGDDDLI